jgi:TetR/AcrR family transcriptional regulator, transcriptional repressor of bet genes
MPRPSNTQARRDQIVDGLLSAMSRAGYERASIADIARAAGLSSAGLVHYHFASKQEILVVLVERLAATVEARYRARVERAGCDPQRRLHAFIDAHLALGADADPRAVAAWVAVGAEAVRQPEVRALYAAAIARSIDELRALVAVCLRARGRRTHNARRLAAALQSAIEGAYQLAVAAPDALPRGFAAPAVRKMADSLISAEPRAEPRARSTARAGVRLRGRS